jgi:hypothetical protein
MRAGWLVGSLAVGAAIAHFGTGAGYLVVAAGFIGGGVALLPAGAPPRSASASLASLWRGTVDFFGALRRDHMLLVLMMLTGGAEVLGFAHQALLPSLARDVLHTGPEGL